MAEYGPSIQNNVDASSHHGGRTDLPAAQDVLVGAEAQRREGLSTRNVPAARDGGVTGPCAHGPKLDGMAWRDPGHDHYLVAGP